MLRVSWACLGSEGSFRICRVLASKALRFRVLVLIGFPRFGTVG